MDQGARLITAETCHDLLIRHVDVWNDDGLLKDQDVVVKNGVIAEVSRSDPARQALRVLHGGGCQLLPAGVDAQVHLRVPGQREKETAKTGVAAAVRGGIGAMLTMPNTKPVLDSVAACETARAELDAWQRLYGVEVLLSAAITVGQLGKKAAGFDDLADFGVAAFTDDGYGVESDELMEEVLAASAKHGIPVLQHAETRGHGGILAAGPLQAELGIAPYPPAAETDMVARDLRLLLRHPEARYHVLHISSAETIRLVQESRRAGLSVSCEVSPHHLFFSSEDIDPLNSSFKMNPPLRSSADRQALQAALADGSIDFVATDHAPHESAVKGGNFKTAAFGTLGLETSLRVLVDLWQKRILTGERLVEVFSSRPAQFLGIADRFGRLEQGRPFHGVLIEAMATRNPVGTGFESLAQNSCFTGTPLPDCIRATFLGERMFRFYDNPSEMPVGI